MQNLFRTMSSSRQTIIDLSPRGKKENFGKTIEYLEKNYLQFEEVKMTHIRSNIIFIVEHSFSLWPTTFSFIDYKRKLRGKGLVVLNDYLSIYTSLLK